MTTGITDAAGAFSVLPDELVQPILRMAGKTSRCRIAETCQALAANVLQASDDGRSLLRCLQGRTDFNRPLPSTCDLKKCMEYAKRLSYPKEDIHIRGRDYWMLQMIIDNSNIVKRVYPHVKVLDHISAVGPDVGDALSERSPENNYFSQLQRVIVHGFDELELLDSLSLLPLLSELDIQIQGYSQSNRPQNLITGFIKTSSQKLRCLSIAPGTLATNETAEAIAQCPHLVELSLPFSGIRNSDVLIQITENCHVLNRLNLSGCVHITDTVAEKIVIGCPQLQDLDLSHCPNLTMRGVAILPVAQELVRINLQGCTQLNNLPADAPVFTDEELQRAAAQDCTQLTDLHPVAQVFAKAKSAGWGCENLQELNLEERGVTRT